MTSKRFSDRLSAAFMPALLLWLVCMTTPGTCGAEEAVSGDSGAAPESAAAPMAENAAQDTSRLVPLVDYSGSFLSRPALTGDWGGVRQDLMEKGMRFDFSLTSTFQGVLSGGRRRKLQLQNGMDFGIQLDTGKLGWWPGGLIKIRGEARWGDSSNMDTGALVPTNTDSLYPIPEEDDITLSEFYMMQFLSEKFGIMFGKMSPRDANVFAHDETTQFMNTAFVFNPALATTLPTDFLGAGVLWAPTKSLTISAMALDSEGKANHSGFDTVFDRGTSIFAMAEWKVKPFGLPGHQRLGGTWSDKTRTQLQQNPRTIVGSILQGQTPVLATRSDDWTILYDFDQYLYVAPGTKDCGWGLFGRVGITDGRVNPIKGFYSIGVGGKGMFFGRENDTFGVGYYYLDLSDKLPNVIKRGVRDEQGVELFYNIAVTPWLHVTPDLQVIRPATRNSDTAVVAALRVKMDF